MDVNGLVNVLNALPTAKLITTVSAGIGKLYEPTHIKRIAKAKAEEIRLISGAMEECSIVPTQYSNGELSMNTSDWDDFVRRTQGRMAFQELQKQNNIECIVSKAYDILENEQSCSEEPVEQGWINRFFDSVSNISDEDLQGLWSRVLAGEVKKPNSYSLRTLETLKNISKEEAELFQRVSSFVSISNDSLFLISKTDILKKYGISYDNILALDECGLINSGGMVSLFNSVSDSVPYYVYNKRNLLKIMGTSRSLQRISFGIFGLTQAGRELYSVLECDSNISYFSDLAEEIENTNKGKVTISLHQIHKFDLKDPTYNGLVLHEYPSKK